MSDFKVPPLLLKVSYTVMPCDGWLRTLRMFSMPEKGAVVTIPAPGGTRAQVKVVAVDEYAYVPDEVAQYAGELLLVILPK